ncbi:MAG: hypothetical protein J6A59_03060 [Lachnospiraceae bacterium]|nr:hypothetical protein [Lachnospiraceae bacterium]
MTNKSYYQEKFGDRLDSSLVTQNENPRINALINFIISIQLALFNEREGFVYRSLDGSQSFKNVSREYLLMHS